MAVIQRGILGGFKNKIGNVVGGSWKGIATMRTLPLSVANPQTAGQVAQRTKFSACVALAKFLLVGTIKPLWDRFAQKMSGYNAFVQTNVEFFSDLGVLTYASLVIGKGSLTGGDGFAGSGTNASPDVSMQWNDNTGTGTALGTDEAYIVGYNVNNDEWAQAPAADTRATGIATLTFASNNTTGDVLHFWLSFRRADGTLVSNTSYATDTI